LLLPASAALPGALRQAWRDRARAATRLLLAWIVPSWIVFEAAPTKLPHYTLPLYPALCLLAASWVLARERAPIRRWAAAMPMVVAALLGGALLALPVLLGDQVWLGVPGALAGLLIAASFTPLLRRPGGVQQECRSMMVALAAMPLLYWAGLQVELPRLQQLWIAPRVAAILPPGPFGAVGFAEPSLMFLAGTRTRWLLPEQAARELASGEVRSLLVASRDLAAVENTAIKAGLQPKTVASVTGYNYSRGRPVTVLLLTSGSDLSLR
jgi:4-amino-4-deoxy-L-arabinose transferase-like glycosyltransferase